MKQAFLTEVDCLLDDYAISTTAHGYWKAKGENNMKEAADNEKAHLNIAQEKREQIDNAIDSFVQAKLDESAADLIKHIINDLEFLSKNISFDIKHHNKTNSGKIPATVVEQYRHHIKTMKKAYEEKLQSFPLDD